MSFSSLWDLPFKVVRPVFMISVLRAWWNCPGKPPRGGSGQDKTVYIDLVPVGPAPVVIAYCLGPVPTKKEQVELICQEGR